VGATDGLLQNIYILPPKNLSEVSTNITLSILSQDGNSFITNSSTFDLTTNPVSDTVEIQPTLTFGNQYSHISLNINANARDLDGSENATITLKGAGDKLSSKAWFMIANDDGSFSDINATYDALGKWTLNDVNVADLGKIEVFHPAYYGDVEVSVVMSDDGASTYETPSVGTFLMKIEDSGTIDTTSLGEHNDTIVGGVEDNTIFAGEGDDKLTGGEGMDTFAFNTSLDNKDIIYDFNHADDTILLYNEVFTSLSTGELSADNFVAGTQALDANDFILYDKATGNVSYDADGNGSGSAVVFANFANKPTDIDYTDFMVASSVINTY